MSFRVVDVMLSGDVAAKGLVEDVLEADASARGRLTQSAVVVDFLNPKLRHRTKNGADGEAVVKALGAKRSERAELLVYDFTAGLGTEAFLLARAGFRVVAFERDPRVYELLQDGLRRWRDFEESEAVAAGGERKWRSLSLEFRLGDAASVVAASMKVGSLPRAYAVTLDPMFEGEAIEGKSAPKKEMATLRRMLTPTTDVELRQMFDAALAIADVRVVVKRPNGAPDLAPSDESSKGRRPVHRLEGKTARFDIYSCR